MATAPSGVGMPTTPGGVVNGSAASGTVGGVGGGGGGGGSVGTPNAGTEKKKKKKKVCSRIHVHLRIFVWNLDWKFSYFQ
jgi:hypothetical protein